MKTRNTIFCSSVILVLTLPSICLAYFITINTIQKKAPAVYFDHNNHLNKETGLGFPCKDCHHELNTPEQSPSKCSSCHYPKELTQAIKKDLPLDLKEAYHIKCRGCHNGNRRKYKNAPTSDCGACHKKDFENFLKERSLKELEKIKNIIEKPEETKENQK
ncbi:cytochrome c3 family protein [Candidatus Desantisbacteria bacterium]|nr:cytochrome c3 family protein [Candidatus Desantisbacteria bacterium]